MKRKRRFIYTSVLVSLIAAAWAVIILPRSEYYTYESPSGEYKAIFTYRSYLSFIPMPPGSSGDKPGFVKVIDKTGHDYGELPLDMLNTAEFRWIKYGAKIFNGEWNFKEGTCYYWNSAGEHQIYVKNRKPNHAIKPTLARSVADQ
jgi:hypothetical protein